MIIPRIDTGSPPQVTLRTDWLPGVLLSVLAVVLRILVATRRDGIEVDGILYLQNAKAILTDWHSINAVHPPLYSFLVAPFLGLSTDLEWVGRLVSAVLGGLWVWPTLWLARETTDEDVAWTAGLLVALTPAAVEASTRVLSEAAFGLSLTLFLVVLVRTLRRPSWISSSFAGILGGVATLARPEGMGFLLLAWVLLIAARPLFGAVWMRRAVLTQLAVLTFCWFAIISPYMGLVRSQFGYWHWSGKAGISLLFAEGVGDEGAGSFAERNYVEGQQAPTSVVAYIAARPGETLRRMAINLHLVDKYMLTGLLGSGGLALVILGLASLRFRRAPAPPEWLLALVPLPFAGLLLYLVSARYFVAIIPSLSIIAAIGLARLARLDTASRLSRPSRPSMVLLLVVLLSFVPWIVRPWFRQDPRSVEKAAGIWLRGAMQAGDAFLGSYPVIEYYSGSHGLALGKRPLDLQIAQAQQAGIRFLITDNFLLPAFPLGLPTGTARVPPPPPNVEMVHVSEDRAGRRIFIYRIS